MWELVWTAQESKDWSLGSVCKIGWKSPQYFVMQVIIKHSWFFRDIFQIFSPDMKRWVATKIIQTVQLQPNDAVILRVKSGVEDGMLRAYCSSIVYDDGTIGHVTIDTSQPIHDTCWVNKIFTVARHWEERRYQRLMWQVMCQCQMLCYTNHIMVSHDHVTITNDI